MSTERADENVNFIWSVADQLRGPYKPAQYGDVMLPLTVLRLNFVLEEIKTVDETLRAAARASGLENLRSVFDPAVMSLFIGRMEQNQELFAKLMTDKDLAALVTRSLRQDVYKRILSPDYRSNHPI